MIELRDEEYIKRKKVVTKTRNNINLYIYGILHEKLMRGFKLIGNNIMNCVKTCNWL